MSRRRRPEKREILPDPKFGDQVLSKFMNNLMLDGKKAVAEGIVYTALDVVETKAKANPVELFHAALDNIKPQVEVRSRRVGGATYQVPREVNKRRQQSLAIRWMVDAARAKRGKPMAKCLAEELFDAFNNQGAAVTKKENVHKMAEANSGVEANNQRASIGGVSQTYLTPESRSVSTVGFLSGQVLGSVCTRTIRTVETTYMRPMANKAASTP